METGVEYNKQRLHKVGYFRELLSTNEEVHPSIQPLLKLSRETIERCQKTEYALVSSLQRAPILSDRIQLLRTVLGVGPITALTWALGDRRCRTLRSSTRSATAGSAETNEAPPTLGDAHAAVEAAKQAFQRALVEAAKLAL
jgi:transposase